MTTDRIVRLAMRMTEIFDRGEAHAERAATAPTRRARASAMRAMDANGPEVDEAKEALMNACREHRQQEAIPSAQPTQEPESWERDDVEAVAACLGDDAAQLRADNDEDERADNMDRAASMLTWMLLTHPVYGAAAPAATQPAPQDSLRAALDELAAALRQQEELSQLKYGSGLEARRSAARRAQQAWRTLDDMAAATQPEGPVVRSMDYGMFDSGPEPEGQEADLEEVAEIARDMRQHLEQGYRSEQLLKEAYGTGMFTHLWLKAGQLLRIAAAARAVQAGDGK